MPKIVVLGTATNVPDLDHENSHMVLVGEERMVLIDGPGSPFLRLQKAGLDPEKLTDIVVTHFHPDHVSGISTLMMSMGLSQRKAPINIYANAHCTAFLKQMFDNYEWNTWHFFPVTFHTVPEEELHTIIDSDEFKVYTSPVKHFVPTFGIIVETKDSGKVFAYSCDTAPTASVVSLAQNADVFIHEAAGASEGHSSAKQAAEMAVEANVKELLLIHYPVNGFDYQKLVGEAKEVFSGPVSAAEDFLEINLS
ncbi:MAG: MBL fold metallo-hydrolase [Chloroflexi bacterium]|nr:MBL fold metallo-hydrolase [Chloroflexota bacterium]